jgi:hypothetical protein
VAIIKKEYQIAKFLVERSVDIEYEGGLFTSSSALILATTQTGEWNDDHEQLLKLLIAKGAKTDGLSDMCDDCLVTPRIEDIVVGLMHQLYINSSPLQLIRRDKPDGCAEGHLR